MAVYTFVCLTRNQVAATVDLQDLLDGRYRQHAVGLLREHASAAAVEVWRGDEVLETIDRTAAGTWSAADEPINTVQGGPSGQPSSIARGADLQ
jgi:hypothetical protein